MFNNKITKMWTLIITHEDEKGVTMLLPSSLVRMWMFLKCRKMSKTKINEDMIDALQGDIRNTWTPSR
jgi:hypothetical protein